MPTREKWPAEGNADYSLGQSRLANFLGTLRRTLFGGVEAIKQDANSKIETANDESVRYLLSSSETDSTVGPEGGAVDGSQVAAVMAEAYKYVPKSDGGTSSKNIPYHWASEGPGGCSGIKSHGLPEDGSYSHDVCFDCSGYASRVYKDSVSINVPSQSQAACSATNGRDILTNPSAADLKSDKVLPGDLVFFKKSGASATHHVAICVGDGTGDMLEAPSTGSHVKKSSILSRSDTYKIRRFLPESAYQSAGQAGSATGVDTLEGYTLPVKTGYAGFEESIDSEGRVPSTGNKVTFHQFAKLGQEYRDYYITMRWNYVAWKWDGHATDVDNKQTTWFHKKPRIVLVTNTRTGAQIYAAVLESGPAPWTGTEGGKSDSKQKALWGQARRGNPSGYTGRSAGFPPKAKQALGYKQQEHGKGGDLLKFEWAKDQSVKPGPVSS